jgi:hypothetical protein
MEVENKETILKRELTIPVNINNEKFTSSLTEAFGLNWQVIFRCNSSYYNRDKVTINLDLQVFLNICFLVV